MQWLKQESEAIQNGEALLEVMTDKSSVEVESPVDGILARILAAEGDVLEVGSPLAVIAGVGEEVTDEGIAALLAKPVAEEAPSPAPDKATSPVSVLEANSSSPMVVTASFRAAPRVRKLADELGVNVAAVAAAVDGEVISEDDVRRFAQNQGAGGQRADNLGSLRIRERIPLTGARRTLFNRMTQAWQTIPHFHQIIDIDAEPLHSAHQRYHVTLTAFFVRAAAIALTHHPFINAAVEGDDIVLFEDVNISVAVWSEQGLVVPVLRQANQKSLQEVAAELRVLSERTRAGELTPSDLSGGTFTISNLGMYGIETGTPIINPPQVALMFVGSTQTVPVFQGDKVVAGQRLKVTLSYDHRIIDGVTGAAFSQEVRTLLHDPEQLAAKP